MLLPHTAPSNNIDLFESRAWYIYFFFFWGSNSIVKTSNGAMTLRKILHSVFGTSEFRCLLDFRLGHSNTSPQL